MRPGNFMLLLLILCEYRNENKIRKARFALGKIAAKEAKDLAAKLARSAKKPRTGGKYGFS